MRFTTVRALIIVALVRLVTGAIVWVVGFRAVSDDDYARLSLAQRWAADPVFDPTGTSWLPLPFWIYGLAQRLFGRGLLVGHLTALLLGVLASWGVYWAAKRVSGRNDVGMLAGVLACLVPWGARLGIAPVPELPVAALMLVALVALVRTPRGLAPIAGGLALFVACLCRYEPWPLAIAFSAVALWLARVRGKDRHRLISGATLAVLAPLGWMAWNRYAHGDPLHFVGRVAAFKRALGQPNGSTWSDAFQYPVSLALHEPEIFFVLWILVAAVLIAKRRPQIANGFPKVEFAGFRLPLLLTGAVVLALSVAALGDGAPTHHPERALLFALLLVVCVASALIVRFVRLRPSRILGLVTGLAIVLSVGLSVRFRWVFGSPDAFAQREDEVAIGQATVAHVAPGERVLLQVVDYGYFAVLAASGKPELFIKDRDIDPRNQEQGSSFPSPMRLSARAGDVGASWVVGHRSSAASGVFGPPVERRGMWDLYRVSASGQR